MVLTATSTVEAKPDDAPTLMGFTATGGTYYPQTAADKIFILLKCQNVNLRI